MLPEPLPLDYPIRPSPNAPEAEEQIRSLIDREFLAETSYFSGLLTWLNQITLDRLSGRITGFNRSGKSVASQYWVDHISGRRGDLLPLPLRIHMVECNPSCDARKLCNLISGSLNRRAIGGKQKDFMFRAWDALKLFKVDILLIDNAIGLTETALSTVITMSRHRAYRIPVVLIGSTDLDAWLKRCGKLEYFQSFYRFENLSENEFSGTVKTFERDFLNLPDSVDLIDADSLSTLYSKTHGNIEDLVDIMIKVIRRSSNKETLYFDKEVLTQVLRSYGESYSDEEP